MLRRRAQNERVIGFGSALFVAAAVGCVAAVALKGSVSRTELVRTVIVRESLDACELQAAENAELTAAYDGLFREPAQGKGELSSARARSLRAMARFEGTRHAALVRKIADAQNASLQALGRAGELLRGGKGLDEASHLVAAEATAAREEMDTALTTVVQSARVRLEEAERESRALAERHITAIAAVTGAALVLAAVFGTLLSAAFTSANRRLKEAVQRHREAAEQLDRLLANAPVGIAFLDRDLRFLRLNRPLAELNGAPIGAHLGKTLGEATGGGSPIEPLLLRVLQTGIPLAGVETHAVDSRTGLAQCAHASVFPLRDAGGLVKGLGAVVLDISERKRHEEGLQILAEVGALLAHSTEVAHALPQLAHILVPRLCDWCALDLIENGAIRTFALVHADAAKQRVLEDLRRRFPPSLAGNSLYSEAWALGEPRVATCGTELLDSAGGCDPDLRALHEELRLSSVLVVPVFSRGWVMGALTLVGSPCRFAGALALAEEVGRRLSLALEKAELLREAQEAVAARDEFLSIASHELRTPLTALLLHLERLRRRLHSGGTMFDEALSRATRQAEKMSKLIERLLDGSGLLVGNLRLDPTRFDLAELARDVAEVWATDARRAGCDLKLDVSAVEGLWDRVRVEQAVSNLISNALKYGAGTPVEIIIERDGAAARLRVRDHGPGVAAEHRERLFTRFERANAPRDLGGLGLGLYVARHIAEAHAGRLSLETTPGGGATFSLELPLGIPNPEKAAA